MTIELKQYNEIQKIAGNLNTLCFCNSFKSASRLISKYYTKMMQPVGITSSQFNMLITIFNHRSSPISSTEFANAMHMDRTTVTRNMEAMFRSGLVTEIDSSDKRKTLYTLTDNGMKCVVEAIPRWKMGQKRVNEIIEDAEANARNGDNPISIARLKLVIEGLSKL